MKVLNNEKGFVKLIFVILLLVFMAYLGYSFGMPYYRYSAFKSDVREMARISLGNEERTRAQILEKAEEYRIPITEDTLNVTVTSKSVRVSTAWSETVDVLGLYQKTLRFNVDIEE
ncbi:MAG: hypothetical protein AB1442_00060 [Nitrospirota bacterium]